MFLRSPGFKKVKLITLFEHETIPWAWTDRDLDRIEKLNRASGVELLKPTVSLGSRCLQSSSQVGVIRLGQQTIQVLPKIYRDESYSTQEEKIKQASRSLFHMLALSGHLPIREQEINTLLRQDLDWFEVLTRLFASHLSREWQRGPYRNYFVQKDTLPVLKGKWNIADQIRRVGRMHRFDVSYDEFGSDNQFNRVFRYVVERLWELSNDTENRRLLNCLRQWMDEVCLVPQISIDEIKRIIINRLNQRFEPEFNLAMLFVDGGSLQLARGTETAFSMTFDMNALYKSFIINFIAHNRIEILPDRLQSCDLLPQSRSATRYLAVNQDGQNVFHLKPDLAFRLGDDFPLILDTKYKVLNKQDFRQSGVSQDDFYQMYAYAHRYDCPRVILLFPEIAGLNGAPEVSFSLRGEMRIIEVHTIDLKTEFWTINGKNALINQLRAILEENHAHIGLEN